MIVRGFDAVTDGRFPHLVTEHLEGPTLRELIDRDGALAPEQALPLGLHAASALHYMAGEGMVHLDVKPENIVMGAPPRLIDLSVARSVEAARRLRTAIGTDAYMAPEQCDPARGADRPAGRRVRARRDAASRGRRQPAVPAPRHATSRSSCTTRSRCRGGCRGGSRSCCGPALAREPGDRPSAAELAAGLEPLVAELPRRMVLGRRGWRRR